MTDSETLLLGIDGGGTGCRARLVAGSRVLAEGAGGAANLTLGVDIAAASILQAAREACARAGLPESTLAVLRAGIGAAGADASSDRGAQLAARLPFASTIVRNDAEIACLGAHEGDGAILILGTGSHGLLIREGRVHRVGGWGFMLSDTGSGAVLGHRAARRALLAHEGVAPASPFTARVMARFDARPAAMLEWALAAIPRDWAALAPLVFEAARAGDPVAVELQAQAVAEVEELLDRLAVLGAERIALLGGLAAIYRPLLPPRHGARLVEPAGDPLDGALRLARSSGSAAGEGGVGGAWGGGSAARSAGAAGGTGTSGPSGGAPG